MKWLATLLLAIGLCAAGGARAQTCTASATALAFGNYQPLAATTASSTASITVTCQAVVSLLVAYVVQINVGSGPSFANRTLFSGSNALKYQVYRDSLNTQVWGDGTAGTFVNVGGYLLSVLVPVTTVYIAYGLIPASQNVGIGNYADTLTVTVIY